MNKQITHVSLDLETLATSTKAIVLSVGIATSCGREFHLFIDLHGQVDAGRELSIDTMMWWMQQSDAARAVQVGATRHEVQVARQHLAEFFASLPSGYLVWGNAPSFDCDILADFMGAKPWPFWAERDVRTARMAVGSTKADVAHDSLSDAKAQLVDVLKFVNLANAARAQAGL